MVPHTLTIWINHRRETLPNMSKQSLHVITVTMKGVNQLPLTTIKLSKLLHIQSVQMFNINRNYYVLVVINYLN